MVDLRTNDVDIAFPSHRLHWSIGGILLKNRTDLARLGNVTRTRMTQIMNLLMLGPEIQEELLFLPRVEARREEVLLRDLQLLAGAMAWRK